MLLDPDQGSMSTWKGEELMGVVVTEGLTGPLCWAGELSPAILHSCIAIFGASICMFKHTVANIRCDA